MDWSRKWIGLALLAALALGLRVGLTLTLSRRHAAPVTYEHGEIAENLLAGKGFSVRFLGQEGPTSQQAPLYPALLAGVYWVVGVGTEGSLLVVQLLQCMAGTGLVLAVAWLAWSLVPERPMAGWAAGIGAALYPTHIYMVTHIQVAVWAALVLTLLACVIASPRWQGTASGALLAGLLSGLLLLVEPILAIALPILGAAFWLHDVARQRRHATFSGPTLRLALMASVAAVVIAPWLWRNNRVHGEFVFIKSTFGYALWQGNNPVSWGTDKVPKPGADDLRRGHDGSLAGIDKAMWEARHETLYIDDVLLKPGGYREFVGLSEPARSRLLASRAWDFIRDNPAAYVRLCLARLRYFLLFDETNPKAANPVYRLATVVWLALAAAGVWLSRAYWSRLWPTFAVFAAVTIFHALTIVSARFRIPLEPLSFVWCGLAVSALATLFEKRGIRIVDPLIRRCRVGQAVETL